MKTMRFILIAVSLGWWAPVSVAQLPAEPGNVVFSASPIDPASPAGLQTEFKAGDHLYAVAYLPQTLRRSM